MSLNNIPILSIITVCYNSEETIQQTFSSIKELKNLTSKIEYIVIDGNSTDSTKAIIEQNKDIIDQYISEPDQGIYDGMNKGAKLSSGKYILYINSDDYVNPNKLKTIIEVLLKNNYDFIGCDVLISNLNGEIIGKRSTNLKQLNWKHRGMPCSHQGFIIKSSFFKSLGYFTQDFKIACDYELILKCLSHSKNYKNIHDAIATYTLGGVSFGNVAKGENFRLQKKYINTIIAIKNYLREYVSSFIQKILPNSLIIIFKKLKKSDYAYIEEK